MNVYFMYKSKRRQNQFILTVHWISCCKAVLLDQWKVWKLPRKITKKTSQNNVEGHKYKNSIFASKISPQGAKYGLLPLYGFSIALRSLRWAFTVLLEVKRKMSS